MKKSFSVLLSAAVAFGSFASFASAADELTAQQKFDALKAKGIFTGVNSAGDAGLDQNMNRAQFARVAALILGLEGIGNPDTLKVTEKPFPDVDLGKWYTEEVSAVKAAKVLVGNADGTFNPEGNISVQELAVVTANLLGLKAVEGAKVEGAADWAAGYIQAIKDAGVDFPTNYTQPATRAQLVGVSYQADAQLNPVAPAKASVTSAKAAGVKTVTVTLDKAVDTDKATLTLKRGTATVATTTKWSDDKKSATLTLTSTKIADSDYSVVLGGIAAEEIATASASFKGEDEKVAKLEFATSSDEIAKSTQARIKLRAENQYGEEATFSPASYSVSTDSTYNATLKKVDGSVVVELDTTGGTAGLTQIPIYVFNNDNHVTVSKTFKLGFTPFASKLTIGEAKYSNGKDNLVAAGDKVTFDLSVLDQYGNPMTGTQEDDAGRKVLADTSFNKNIAPYLNYNAGADQQVAVSFADVDSDDEFEATVSLTKALDKANTHSLTVYTGSASQSVEFKVGSAKVATKVDFDAYDGVVAEGDGDKYVSLLVYDANGDQLTASEIADNVKVDPNRIKVTASGATAEIMTVGPNKGKVKLSAITASAKSYIFVTASVLSVNNSSFKTYQIPVQAARIPASIVLGSASAGKAVLGANSDFDWSVKDQYGDELGGTFNNAAKDQYQVKFEYTDGGSGTTVNNGIMTGATVVGGVTSSTTTQANLGTVNGGFTFDTQDNQLGKATVKATLQKLAVGANPATDWKDLSSATASIETISNASKLTYSLADVASLYAAKDSGLIPGYVLGTDTDGPAKGLSLTVKDSSGDTVAYPANFESVSTSNGNTVLAELSGRDAYVLGNKAGEATVQAVVYKANGETVSLSAKVTVKADTVTVSKLSANGSKQIGATTTPPTAVTVGDFVYNSGYMDLKANDQYGVEYANGEIKDYDSLLGIRYSVSDIEGATVTINTKTGEILTFNQTGAHYQFVVTATAPNGTTASTLISDL